MATLTSSERYFRAARDAMREARATKAEHDCAMARYRAGLGTARSLAVIAALREQVRAAVHHGRTMTRWARAERREGH